MKPLRMATALVILGAATAVSLLALYNIAQVFYLPAASADRSPEQPIAFSHRIHAGQYGIACLYCHRYGPVSATSGVPDVDTCRACHLYIAPDRPEIRKLIGYVKRNEAIPWVKVHDLPDFVYFPHRIHLNAKVRCDECHGEVRKMDRVERVSGLNMLWCLGCHRERGAAIDCWACHQ